VPGGGPWCDTGMNRAREGYAGTGRGAITPDGCPVAVHERLVAGEEPAIVRAAAPAATGLLELGCGAGRLTRALTGLGFAVTAVDESADMLALAAPGAARTVRSPIEALRLGERFDVVLLASFLVHAGDERVRRGLLDACRRHVADEGCVLVQREGADWHERVPREGPLPGGGTARVVSSEPAGPGVRSVHVEYAYPDGTWTQTFLSRPLTDDAFREALAASGLAVDAVLTADGTWVRALPLPA
jgi:SAM-dependent methyltransferase